METPHVEGPPWELDVPKNIHLALSGGGYRAAAFHLGMFSVLDKLGLLESVSALSTVSGGSILGALYWKSLHDEKDFDDFFIQTFELLRDEHVLKSALEKVGREGMDSLIVSAAAAYADDGFLGDLRFGDMAKKHLHLREVAINATEFYGGNSFRFIQSQSPMAYFGNNTLRVNRKIEAPKIRLADAVAASSCFPGAFEPIAFPHDFDWDGDTPEGLSDWAPLALMDGGIYDNQGVTSLLLANRRADEVADLILISDTFQFERPLFSYLRMKRFGGLPVVVLILLIGAGLVAGLAGGFWMVYQAAHQGTWLLAALTALGLLPALILFVAPFLVWLKLRVYLRSKFLIPSDFRRSVGRLPLPVLINMIHSRLSSVMAMAAQIFMKIVRENVYAAAFQEVQIPDHNIVTNEIFDLQRENAPELSSKAEAVVRTANAMPTLLWVESEAQLRDVIACGQLTTCHNLLTYIEEFAEVEDISGPLRALADAIQLNIEALNADPHCLIGQA